MTKRGLLGTLLDQMNHHEERVELPEGQLDRRFVSRVTRQAEVEVVAEDDLATAEARVIEWAINRIEAEAVSWNTVDRCTRQLDVVTRALIKLRGKG